MWNGLKDLELKGDWSFTPESHGTDNFNHCWVMGIEFSTGFGIILDPWYNTAYIIGETPPNFLDAF